MARNSQISSSSALTVVGVALSLILALGSGGCSSVTCSKFCDACMDGSESCQDECKDDYKDGSADCRSAMRDLADCVDDKGCDGSCVSEGFDVASEC